MTPELTKAGKPDPGPYLMGASLFGAEPSKCIVLEDAPSGVAAGVAAGMKVIAIVTTHTREELTGADAFIDRLAEFPRAVARLT